MQAKIGKIDQYILDLVGNAIRIQGNWDASINDPDISATTVVGNAWVVSVDGTTDLGGTTDWKIGDMAVKTSTGWIKVDNTEPDLSAYAKTADLVTSVPANETDPLSLHLDPLGQTMLGTLSGTGLAKLTAGVWGVDTNSYALTSALAGYAPTSRTLTINGTSYDLSADRSWTIPSDPAGADTQVQFNDGGAFGGDANFTWGKTTNLLKILNGSLDIDRFTTPYTGNNDVQGVRSRMSVNSTATANQLLSGMYSSVKDTSAKTVSNWSGWWRHEGLYNLVESQDTTAGTVYDGEASNYGIYNLVYRDGVQKAAVTDYWAMNNVGIYNSIVDRSPYQPSSNQEAVVINDYGLQNDVSAVYVSADTGTVRRNVYGTWNRVTVAAAAVAQGLYGTYNYIAPTNNVTTAYGIYSQIATTQGGKQYGIYSTGSGSAILNVLKGNTKFGNTVGDATAQIHLSAGSATAGTAPIKFTSGTLTTAAVAGQMEFLTDDFYLTIGTGSARQKIVLTAGLTLGRIPYTTTAGRLADSASLLFSGTTLTLAGRINTNELNAVSHEDDAVFSNGEMVFA